MSRFLEALADTFAPVADLGSYCFLFPTRRAGRFFLDVLADKIQHSALLPRVDTLGHWVERCAKATRAGDHEPVFILYNAYCALLQQHGLPIPEFEKFRQWGTALSADFQDIDRNLVDADRVFANVKNLREISTDYLTDKQREIIRRYWGADALSNMAASPERVRRFWQSAVNAHNKPKSVSHKYLRLWEVLPQLYKAHNNALRAVGTATQGMMLRDLAENIIPAEVLTRMGVKKLVFAGFDNLSLAELEIMSKLQKEDAAFFYWDIPPLLSRLSPSLGYPLIKNLAESFPEPEELPLRTHGLAQMPEITITGVPGHLAQTRAAAATLSAWADDPAVIPDAGNAINTSVVLPEADLFMPMVHSVPAEFQKINLTVGIPLRLTPVGTMMQQLVKMQSRARRKKDGLTTYFYEDVKGILTNPIVRTYAPDEADELLKRITAGHLFRVSTADFAEAERLRPLFLDPDTDPALLDNPDGPVMGYIMAVTDFLRQADAANPKGRHNLTELFIDYFRDSALHLCANLEKHHISLRNTTLLRMIQQTMMSYEVPLSGEPVEGLQIMGIPQTQGLDFDNFVMLSLNENVFPQKAYRRSLIPDLLRTAWGLSTSRQIDRLLAYRFFRLVAHARNVALFYDTRADGLRNPRMSRFLYQLIYLPQAKKPRHTTMQFPLTATPKRKLGIARDDRVRTLLQQFLPPGKKGISPSALKTFLACPLHFYLQYVEELNIDDELTDSIDSAMFGTILHSAFEYLYKEMRQPDGTITVTPQRLQTAMDTPGLIRRHLRRAYNANFAKTPDGNLDAETPPSTDILFAIMEKMMRNTMRAEATGEPFTILGTEVPIRTSWELVAGHPVNFKGYIDRLDRLDPSTLRMVDYKTGSDALSAPSYASLFIHNNSKNTGAILQLLTYAHLYNVQFGTDLKVTPSVYLLRTPRPGDTPLAIGERANKRPITDHHETSDAFLPLLRETLCRIFDFNNEDSEGFPMSDDPHACRFCKMRILCQTTPPQW